MTTPTALAILSGIFWTITYLLIIRRSIQDKSVGMPLVALCMNISWEFIFSFVFPSRKPQLYINYVWFFLDLVIVIQYLKFNKFEFSKHFPQNFFHPTFFSVLAVSFFNMLFITYEFGRDRGAIYTAFQINLIMSMLFISMLLSRGDVRGQSMYIAIAKTIGTACASLSLYLSGSSSMLLIFLYLSIFLFDLVYSVLFYIKIKEQKINPWKRA
ncbi:transmembrane-type terpene cyclase [Chroococcidiopsis sp.]|uniref:transmembrane-type terpene cyclase n=1 Tax=Chroococcidiopsis sp. TaxID=3088168 RepID=UPI003F317810